MRPLIRWTIGRVESYGWDVFLESVRFLPKVYPEFDYVICHNHLTVEELWVVASLGIDLHEQKEEQLSVQFQTESRQFDTGPEVVNAFGWKWVPPRLRLGAHELWVDNDIVIRDRVPEIDEWLTKEVPIISSGYFAEYGQYQHLIPDGFVSCAGFFGLPPGLDLLREIQERVEPGEVELFDEQGLTTAIVTSVPGWMSVSIDNMRPLGYLRQLPDELPPAMHFIGANRKPRHRPWEKYRRLVMP